MYPDLIGAPVYRLYGHSERHGRFVPRASSGWAQVIEMVGLTQAADRKIKGFSGGMKRRVGIAQALVNDPRILIVDEPTAGLDPEERIRFRNLLVDLATDRVVILSTHIVEDIGQTCRDMAVLSKGQILFRGSPLELTRAAEGRVWTVLSQDARKPNNGLTVVSMLHMAEGVQYRLVGADAREYPAARPLAARSGRRLRLADEERRADLNDKGGIVAASATIPPLSVYYSGT